MKLTVYNTSMFDFENIGNEDGGLVFEVEQGYSDADGFFYLAECEEPHIVVLYKNRDEFETELNDEIVSIYTLYSEYKEEELTQGAIRLRDFGIKCFTEFKR